MTDLITKTKILTTVGIVASSVIVPVTFDNLVLTDTEIQTIREEIDFTPDEDLIYKTILLDKKMVQFDLTKMTKKEVDDILMGTMLKLGIKKQDLIDKVMKGDKINFDDEIKKKSKEKTSIIREIIK